MQNDHQSADILKTNKIWTLLFMAWLLASIATLGSLFFSQVMLFAPCSLCWYQRICMYPLVVLFLAALVRFDKSIVQFSAPLGIIGWSIALYHNLLTYKIIPEDLLPCVHGVPCSTVYINWLGFITIPFLSFLAFTLILAVLFFLNKEISK
jgi:disulfide bond formation protein DsbB